jgi:hypothetical protein
MHMHVNDHLACPRFPDAGQGPPNPNHQRP